MKLIKKKPESGFELYLKCVFRAVDGTRKEKKREAERVRAVLNEIPHAETMSYEILCAAVGEPESFAVSVHTRPKRSPLIVLSVIVTASALLFMLGMAIGQAREKTETGGYVESYRYEDGSLQEFLEENKDFLK